MMKVKSPYSMEDGSWTPLLVFITDYALYVASVKPGGTEYEMLCRLPHNELDAIVVSIIYRNSHKKIVELRKNSGVFPGY